MGREGRAVPDSNDCEANVEIAARTADGDSSSWYHKAFRVQGRRAVCVWQSVYRAETRCEQLGSNANALRYESRDHLTWTASEI